MSSNNGVIRVGRKGRKKFAFGEDGIPFEVDVVVAFQQWIVVDDQFRERTEERTIPVSDMAEYHQAAVDFVERLANTRAAEKMHNNELTETDTVCRVTTAEALDFIARLREQYDEVAAFFQPRSREEPDSPATSAAELHFSVEGS